MKTMQWQHQQTSPKANTTHQEHETSTCWKQTTPVPHKEEKTNKSVFPSRWTAGSALSCTGSPRVCCIQNPELPELTPCPFHTESSLLPSHVAAALCQNPDRGHSRVRRVLGARRAPSFARKAGRPRYRHRERCSRGSKRSSFPSWVFRPGRLLFNCIRDWKRSQKIRKREINHHPAKRRSSVARARRCAQQALRPEKKRDRKSFRDNSPEAFSASQ